MNGIENDMDDDSEIVAALETEQQIEARRRELLDEIRMAKLAVTTPLEDAILDALEFLLEGQ